MKKRPIVILDLDETLINSEDVKKFNRTKYEDKMELFKWHKMGEEFYVFERPGLQKFLNFLFENFEVSVWTAASKGYALWILENILKIGIKNRQVKHILFDYHCKASENIGNGKKDLRILSEQFNLTEYNIKNIIIIDDNQEVYDTQPSNCITVEEFQFKDNGSENDKGLEKIIMILKKIFTESK
jgi:TFIIF-interacting CTD phosphatase-like protein